MVSKTAGAAVDFAPNVSVKLCQMLLKNQKCQNFSG